MFCFERIINLKQVSTSTSFGNDPEKKCIIHVVTTKIYKKKLIGSFLYFGCLYRPQRSCGQGNIFTPVCHSVHRGGSASVHAGIPTPARKQTPPAKETPLGADTPTGSRLRHTVNERPVRILLECILV